MSTSGKSPAMQTLRILVGAVVAAIFVMGVALAFVLGFGAPPLGSVVLLVLLGAGLYFVIDRVGYRVTPVSPQLGPDEARRDAMRQFQNSLIRRLTLAESVALVGVLLAFLGGSVLVYDVGAALSVLLLAVHVWPSIRTVDKVVGALERNGAHTGLREMLGFGGTADGPVTRLG